MHSTLEKVKIVEFYETINSVCSTQRKFCQHLNIRLMPSSETIKFIVVKFQTKGGSVLYQQKGAYGRPKECRTVETVRLSVIEGLKKSYRKRAQTLNIKPVSLLTILRKDLK